MNKKIIFALIGIILILGVITTVVLAKSNNNTNIVESYSTKTNSVEINQTNIDSSYTINDDQIEDTDNNLYNEALELPSCCY